mmetsp:Transcript_51930/g.57975  ORF Transcript_51930/g.57975 Transcript_51930/m.57975 type:complete len:218 (+) Transcript_51930:207-860(+)
MSSQKGLQVVPSRFTSTKSKFRKIPTIFIVLIPVMLSVLLIYLSMKNFSVNNNNDDVIINTSMAAAMATKPSLINSSKSQSKPKEQIIQTGATTTTSTAAAAVASVSKGWSSRLERQTSIQSLEMEPPTVSSLLSPESSSAPLLLLLSDESVLLLSTLSSAAQSSLLPSTSAAAAAVSECWNSRLERQTSIQSLEMEPPTVSSLLSPESSSAPANVV